MSEKIGIARNQHERMLVFMLRHKTLKSKFTGPAKFSLSLGVG